MTSILGEKLTEALNNKSQDLNSFIWKGPKVNGVQEEIKLMDCDYDQLHRFYKHCTEMLYNDNDKNPGRVTLLGIVSDQINKCRAELMLRWLRSERQYTSMKCFEDLKNTISNSGMSLNDDRLDKLPISSVYPQSIPDDYADVPISVVLKACLDQLGVLSTKHVTTNFIVKMGLWFTTQEMQKDLYRKDPETGKTMNRLDVVKEELNLDPRIQLRICDTGLTYNEFKTMHKLRRDKYANLTSDQLKLLANKILYRFQVQCDTQAKQWLDKREEILKVAEAKGWDVTRDI